MEDDEYPDQETRSKNDQGQCQPERDLKGVHHEDPEQNVRANGIDDLPDAAF